MAFQIGCGAQIASKCHLKVISDFRRLDIALGGFSTYRRSNAFLYDACINLGGFANVSYQDNLGKRLAFDICPVNIVLNELVHEI